MAKNRKKIRIIAICLFVSCILLFLILKVLNGFKKIQNSFSEDLPFTYSIPLEDSNLIARKYWSKMKVNKIAHSKERGPVSFLSFNKEYHLITYRIDLIKDVMLKDILHASIESVDRTTGTVYTVIDINDFCRFQYKASPAKPVSKIFLTVAGDSLQNVKNDSIESYHLLCDNFSIRYNENEPIDIFMVGQEIALGATTRIPMDLLFLKRNAAIYLLIMTPNDPKSVIASDLLFNIVMGI